MRRSRRGGGSGLEFGGSGEDSFVAVVVTKLTGALLFILLLTMVIMALIPRANDSTAAKARAEAMTLAIATPETLPEAIAGRPYLLALAATGASGPVTWTVDGTLPEGLSLNAESGLLKGTPRKGTSTPQPLTIRAHDEASRATRATSLTVYESDRPLTTPSRYLPRIPPIPWRDWLIGHGFGFAILILTHIAAMATLGRLEGWSLSGVRTEDGAAARDRSIRSRFTGYRIAVRIATLAALGGLAFWISRASG